MFAVKGTGLQSRGALVPFVSRKTGKEREGDRGHDVLNKYPRLELFPLFNTWICKRDKKNPVLYRPLWKGNLDQWLNNRLSGIIQVCVRWERFLGRCLMAELSCQIESRSVCSNHLEGKASTQSCSKRSLKKRGKGNKSLNYSGQLCNAVPVVQTLTNFHYFHNFISFLVLISKYQTAQGSFQAPPVAPVPF